MPIDAAFYQRIADGIGPDAPAGMLLHLATALPGGGLRYLDIWESEDAWSRFVEEQDFGVRRQRADRLTGRSEQRLIAR